MFIKLYFCYQKHVSCVLWLLIISRHSQLIWLFWSCYFNQMWHLQPKNHTSFDKLNSSKYQAFIKLIWNVFYFKIDWISWFCFKYHLFQKNQSIASKMLEFNYIALVLFSSTSKIWRKSIAKNIFKLFLILKSIKNLRKMRIEFKICLCLPIVGHFTWEKKKRNRKSGQKQLYIW